MSKINSIDPINIFVKSEAQQIINLSRVVENTCADISSALFNNGVLTSAVMKNSLSLLQNRIPDCWVNLWDGSELPANYLKSLGKKILNLNNYVKNALNDTVLKGIINISELIHPEVFLSALRQKSEYRKNRTPIDQMTICYDFNGNINRPGVISAEIKDSSCKALILMENGL